MFLHNGIVYGLKWNLNLTTKKSIFFEHKGEYGLYLDDLNIYTTSIPVNSSQKNVSAAAFIATKYPDCLIIMELPNEHERFWLCFIEDGFIAPTGSVINDIDLKTYMYNKKYKLSNKDIYYSGDMIVSLDELTQLLPYINEKISMHKLEGHQYNIVVNTKKKEVLDFLKEPYHTTNILDILDDGISVLSSKLRRKLSINKLVYRNKLLYVSVLVGIVFCIVFLAFYYMVYEHNFDIQKKRQEFIEHQKDIKAKKREAEHKKFLESFKVKSMARTILIVNLVLENRHPLVYGWQINNATLYFDDEKKQQDDSLRIEVVYKRKSYSNIDQVPRIKELLQARSYILSKDNNYASFMMYDNLYSVNEKVNILLENKVYRKDSLDYLISELQSENIDFNIKDENSIEKKSVLRSIDFSGYNRRDLYKLYLVARNIDNVIVDKISIDFDSIGNVDSWKIVGKFYV